MPLWTTSVTKICSQHYGLVVFNVKVLTDLLDEIPNQYLLMHIINFLLRDLKN